MNINEIKARVEELLNGSQEYTEAEQKEINTISLMVLRAPVKDCNCTNRYFDTLIKCRAYLKEHDTLNTCKYELQRGVLFRMNGEMYTNANLTNEAAEWFMENFEEGKKAITKIIADELTTTATTTATTAVKAKKSTKKAK